MGSRIIAYVMKITKITPLLVNVGNLNWVFTKVETDTPGLWGWGESTLEWKPTAVAGAIKDLSPLIEGRDPRRVEFIWQIMYRQAFYRGGITVMSAMSGIEQACWDILGKSVGAPVYQLLGGAVRDKVRVYGHLMPTIKGKPKKKPMSLGEAAKSSLVGGLTALKFNPLPYLKPVDGQAAVKKARKMAEEIRKAVGDEIDLMVDFHGRPTPANGMRFGKALEDIGLLFLEEPCLPVPASGLAKIARQVDIPIATGERVVTRQEFIPLMEARACEVVQPDPSHCGGIAETRKIAALAEAYQCSIAPHNPLSPINTQVCAHLGMACPNFLIQECLQRHVPWRDELTDKPLKIVDGHIHPGDKPGLGIEVNEKVCAKHPYKEMNYMQFFHPDGSIADW